MRHWLREGGKTMRDEGSRLVEAKRAKKNVEREKEAEWPEQREQRWTEREKRKRSGQSKESHYNGRQRVGTGLQWRGGR
jgi:hypothetical protein